ALDARGEQVSVDVRHGEGRQRNGKQEPKTEQECTGEVEDGEEEHEKNQAPACALRECRALTEGVQNSRAAVRDQEADQAIPHGQVDPGNDEQQQACDNEQSVEHRDSEELEIRLRVREKLTWDERSSVVDPQREADPHERPEDLQELRYESD